MLPTPKVSALLAVCLAATPAALASQEAAPLRVLSFNVRYGTAADGPNAWPLRRAVVADLLRRQAPDVVGLQEALRFQLDELRADLPGYGEAGVGRDDGRTAGEYAAILFRLDRLELRASGTFWFSDTPEVPGSRSWGNRVTRIATWARLRERAGGATFWVFNVHLDHESQASRERSAELVLRRIAARGDDAPVIVTGDFNAGELNPAVRAMTAVLRDTYRARRPADAVAGTFHGFRGDSTGEKIDFVLTTPDVVTLDAAIDRTRGPDGVWPSDQFAVLAVVRLPAPPRDVEEAVLPDALDAIVVRATRTERRVGDEPLRVEVVDAEEIAEKVAMTPGDVAMLLNETGGLRVQSTAPAVGRATVRVQGMPGRYTLLLADGLPLHGETGALDVTQVPPMDLARVEVVKGIGSALYGGAALGGVINLVSRRPDGARELLLNAGSLGAVDATLWWAGRSRWSLLLGAHTQPRRDRDGDGWADLPGYRRLVVRPRLHLGEGTARSLMATAGLLAEERGGGTLPGRLAPDGAPWADSLTTVRADAGLVARALTPGGWLLAARGSAAGTFRGRRLGDVVEPDSRWLGLAEAMASRAAGRVTWLAGAALAVDAFRSDSAPAFDYDYVVPGLFGQAEWAPTARVGLAVNARADHHSRFGWLLSPRLSALLRLGGGWTLRASGGTGSRGPTPFVEETDAVGLRPFVAPFDVRRERGAAGSLDVGGVLGAVEVSATLFATRVSRQVFAHGLGVPAPQPPPSPAPRLANSEGATRTRGADLLARWRRGAVGVTASYTHVDAKRERWIGYTDPVPLVPRHQGGVVAAYEREGTRVGWELYLVGRQALEDDPYRARSRGYAVTGVLAQQRLGAAQLFVNLENLTDVRQTRWQPLVRPARSMLDGWTTDAWAPLDGRTVNGGVRLRF